MSEDPAEAPDDAAARIAVGPALESASMALSVVLESLPPAERVVFVLNEVFGYQTAEIAGILGRRPGAVR